MVCPYNASRDSVRKDLELSGRNLRVSRYLKQISGKQVTPINIFRLHV
jgi:hypothetical protein